MSIVEQEVRVPSCRETLVSRDIRSVVFLVFEYGGDGDGGVKILIKKIIDGGLEKEE